MEIYDEMINISISKTTVFNKKEALDFHKEFMEYFSDEENAEIRIFIEELRLPLKKRKYEPVSKADINPQQKLSD